MYFKRILKVLPINISNTSKKRSKQQNANISPSLINFGGGFFISANKFFAVQKEKEILSPKHIDCFGCSKQIEYGGANLLVWIDQDHYKREARFCRTCSSELKEMGYFNGK